MFFTRILLSVAAILVVGIITLFLPQYFEPQRDARLVALSDPSDANAFARALAAVTAKQKTELIARELKVLETEPLDSSALQNLAVIPSLGSEAGQIPSYVLPLARYSLRNATAQLMAVNLLGAQKNYDELVERLDVLMRLRPEQGPELFNSLTTLARNRDALPALAKRLGENPPWREAFMSKLAETDKDGQLTYSILTELRSQKGAPRDRELRHILVSWYNDKRIEMSYYLWLDFLSPEDLVKVKTVFDGEFDREPRGMLFDWNIGQPRNVRIAVTNKPGSATDRALILDFAGFKGRFADVTQITRVPPGKYTVRMQHLARGVKTTGGLHWRYGCVEGGPWMGQSPVFINDTPWQVLSFDVEVPTEACNTQALILETASSAALDTQISGQFAFDSIEIVTREGAKE